MILLLLLGGCAPEPIYRVDIAGEVRSEQAGEIQLTFAYAWWGEGELTTPFQPIDTLTLDTPGPFSTSLDYRPHLGEGLLVYGWQDLDGDEVLCALGVEGEPAGLVEVADFPAHTVTLTLDLAASCEGPEGLFP